MNAKNGIKMPEKDGKHPSLCPGQTEEENLKISHILHEHFKNVPGVWSMPLRDILHLGWTTIPSQMGDVLNENEGPNKGKPILWLDLSRDQLFLYLEDGKVCLKRIAAADRAIPKEYEYKFSVHDRDILKFQLL